MKDQTNTNQVIYRPSTNNNDNNNNNDSERSSTTVVQTTLWNEFCHNIFFLSQQNNNINNNTNQSIIISTTVQCEGISSSSTSSSLSASSSSSSESSTLQTTTAIPTIHNSNSNSHINNPFRDTLLRYAGYANEVGESFRYQYPKFVIPSYIVAFGYCLSDAVFNGYQTYNNNSRSNLLPNPIITGAGTTKNNNSDDDNNNRQQRIQETSVAVIDTLLWQSLASVLIPGMTINIIVKCIRSVVLSSRFAQVTTPFYQKWIPTSTGLISIPFIIHPIDSTVDYAMDNTVRKWWW